MNQSQWAYPEGAQSMQHVEGINDIKWRKGYGEDEDSVQVLTDNSNVRAK